jgi:hypothetical protein
MELFEGMGASLFHYGLEYLLNLFVGKPWKCGIKFLFHQSFAVEVSEESDFIGDVVYALLEILLEFTSACLLTYWP